MKKTSLILGTLCLGLTLSAQPGIVSTREANNPSGKVLTMEETILSRELSPESLYSTWTEGSELVIRKDNKWQVYDIKSGALSDLKAQPAPSLNAVTKGQSLYLVGKDGKETPVAVSENDQITYGQFTSRNEFGIEDGIFWSPDSTKVAFYKKDESKVTSFPLLDITTRTGSLKEIKYPMAGMESEIVQVGVYNLMRCSSVYLKVNDFGEDQYLTNISWTPDGTKVLVQVLDRSQKHMHLNMYDANTGAFIKTILTEDNAKYVEPQDPVWFVKGYENLFSDYIKRKESKWQQ